MLKGTQVLIGEPASEYLGMLGMLQQILLERGDYLELVVPFIWKGELVPNVHLIIQDMHKEWSKSFPDPIKLFYSTRTFKGIETTKFGVNILGDITSELEDECIDLLFECMERYGNDFVVKEFDNTFKVIFSGVEVAVGHKYKNKIGWVINIDLLLLVDT